MRYRRAIPACIAAIAGTARADLPQGFTRTAVWINNGGVSAIAPLPDGRVLASALFGYISLVREGQAPILLHIIPDVVTTDEHGVLGLCIDPAFDKNGFFYVLYTGPGPYNLVARYTLANNAVNPASRTVIWQNPGLCPGASHQGGAINFGPDGNLYIATGDQYDTPANAQTLVNQHGKILRLAADGSVPPDNPFVTTPGAQPQIFAYGLRNPFRFSIDQLTGSLWIGDVGGSAHEEIDHGHAAANFGWPFMEGPLCSIGSCANFHEPAWSYAHGDPLLSPTFEGAVICGPVYRGTAFPPAYRNQLYYADHVNGWIRRLAFDANGEVTDDLPFDSSPAAKLIVDLKLGQDGALYYAVIQDNPSTLAGVYKISATTGGNQPPVVVANAAPRQGDAPLSVQFDSAGTIDPDAGPQPLTFLWNFGDGQNSTIPSPQHSYPTRGVFHATLTASDGLDPITSNPIAITVGHAPVPTITLPAQGVEYSAGDTIMFAGTATDAEDGTMPPSAFTWSFVLVHLNHTHPFMGSLTGVQGGSFVVPSSGHDPEHTHYRIDLTVRDSDGITTTTSRDLVPRISELRFDTAPAGIPVFLDGRALATPSLYESLVGFEHELSAQPTFMLGGQMYQFRAWSGGQGVSFPFVSPAGGGAFTAIYTTSCYANCDASTGSPRLTANDFQCFINRWAAADPYVNCDGSTTPPVLSANDFQCFLNSFAGGCP